VISSQGEDGPAGATANALTSLSVAPPLALVCFDLSSRTLHAVRHSERFAINVLSTEQEAISRLFATKAPQEEKFAEIPYRLVAGAPVIEGCLAWLVCELESEVQRGDHVIAIGTVAAGHADHEAEPLLFFRSKYNTLTRELVDG
jgi:flavin reductase (DIM6/NTAB) family NADH-FMN oxidoreductase RutF